MYARGTLRWGIDSTQRISRTRKALITLNFPFRLMKCRHHSLLVLVHHHRSQGWLCQEMVCSCSPWDQPPHPSKKENGKVRWIWCLTMLLLLWVLYYWCTIITNGKYKFLLIKTNYGTVLTQSTPSSSIPGIHRLTQRKPGESRSGFSVLMFCLPVTSVTNSPTTITVKHPVAEYHIYDNSKIASGSP